MGIRAAWDTTGAVAGRRQWDEQSAATLAQETSSRFHNLMDAAMLVSFYKYGAVAVGFPERVKAIDTLRLRLEKYVETGNVEHLVDVANFAMIEFMHPANPNAFYKATDQDGSSGRIAANVAIYDTKPNQFRNGDLADVSEEPF